MPRIHPTAIIEDGAELAADVTVDAYARVASGCKVGAGTSIGQGAMVIGRTSIGANNKIWPYAVLGADPQDLKYAGEDTELVIGDHNTIREFASIHRGTAGGGAVTRIGNHNLIMASTHIGHDCQIGHHCILSFNCGLAGHIIVEDYAILGGMTGIHQFVRIGTGAFTSGGSKIGLDLAPFMLCQGMPARLRGINTVGLQRARFSPEIVKKIRLAYRRYFLGHEATADERLKSLKAAFEGDDSPQVKAFLDFVAGASHRGIMHPDRSGRNGELPSEGEEV
jgi:UDP-N-acetylglucosamine acyltransferase